MPFWTCLSYRPLEAADSCTAVNNSPQPLTFYTALWLIIILSLTKYYNTAVEQQSTVTSASTLPPSVPADEESTAHILGRRWACDFNLFNLVMLSVVFIIMTYLWKEHLFFSADVSDLFEVYTELLNVAHNWRAVGRALRLHPDLLNRIEASTTDVERCLERVLSEWLKREYDTKRFGLPSWQLLVAAVAHPAGGKDHALAGQIAERHNGKWEAMLCITCRSGLVSQHSRPHSA